MKKLNLFFSLLIIALVASSCSSDDSDNQNQINNDLIIGKWNVTDIVISGSPLDQGDCELESYLEIFEDGTFLGQTYGGLTGSPCEPDALDTGTWTFDGTIYTETYDEPNDFIVDSVSHEILELTETTMTYRFTIDYPSQGEITEIWSFEREIQ